jgi:hypothetical protein
MELKEDGLGKRDLLGMLLLCLVMRRSMQKKTWG